ncbi:MAG: TIGR03435 family protein, partial [Candidatus Solibacter sp.]|nr:TIGR03435 family protein [Candidatus Solibacter sp.]
KPSVEVPAGTKVHVGVQIDGAQAHCTYLSVKDYLRIAYQVREYQITGPDWLASERFDIHAKLPDGGRGQFREMLQSLLADRFQVKMHRDSKEFSVYAIVVNKGGLKLKESPLDPETEAGVNVTAEGGAGGTTLRFGRGAYFTLADNKFEARKLTMAQLADSLGRFIERPVVDMTDLKGTYDLTLEFTPEEYRTLLIRTALSAGVNLPPEVMKFLEGSSDESLFKGLQALGLKLESRKAPLEVLVVDSVSKTPIAN